MNNTRIFIVGHPGAGKGVLAKTLAEKLNWQLIDADFGLEFNIGQNLSKIMGKEGEKNFHHCQTEILNSMLTKENVVITTDASIIDDKKNLQLLSSELVIYLKVSLAVQLKRLLRHPTPLLENNTSEFLKKLQHKRNDLYEKIAKFTINSDDSALEKHVESIIEIITSHPAKKIKNISALNKKDLIIFHKQLHTPVKLSTHQALCLKLLAQGKSSKEIARELHISHRTIEGYITKMIDQLGCTSSKELIALYYD